MLLLLNPHSALLAKVASHLRSPYELFDIDPRVSDEANLSSVRERLCADCDCLGGFSLGARLAAQLVPDHSCTRGYVGVGFPFHVANARGQELGLPALREVSVPCCVLQGTTDPYGSHASLKGVELPENLSVHFVNGNHQWIRKGSDGKVPPETLAKAARTIDDFVMGLG